MKTKDQYKDLLSVASQVSLPKTKKKQKREMFRKNTIEGLKAIRYNCINYILTEHKAHVTKVQIDLKMLN